MHTEYTECTETYALGMESGDIEDDQITASSFFSDYAGYQPWKGRLNNNGFWSTELDVPTDPWIQVDLLQQTLVTGIITQGGLSRHYEDWVTTLQIQYGYKSEDTLMYILENGQPKVRTFYMFVSITF